MRLKQALTEAIKELSELPNSRLESEVLLSAVLKKERTWLRTHDETELSESQVKLFKENIALRKERVPVAYILGYKIWNDLKIWVDQNTLIPRDETEILVQKILDYNYPLVKGGLGGISVLDIGTGSGCISVFLKIQFPEAEVTGLDISPEALNIARKNAEQHRVAIKFIKSDLLSEVTKKTHYDIIVANLPYVPVSDSLAPEIYQEPGSAIFSGTDGLDLIRELAKQLIEKQISFNQLWLEFLPSQKAGITKIFSSFKVEFITDSGESVFFARIS